MTERCDEAKLPSVWPYLALSALLALLINFGAGYHTYHNSDPLVPVMVSLCRWTSYFWNGNRVGMLLPALALPFQHPYHNLLAQTWMTLFSTFAMIFLLCRFALRRPTWPLAGCAGVALLLLLPTRIRFYVLTFQQMHYPVALALALAALLLLSTAGRPPRWRVVAALVLTALALWVNIGTAVVLGPLLVLQSLLNARPDPACRHLLDRLRDFARQTVRRETILALVVLAAAYVTADLNRRVHPMEEDPIKLGLSAVGTWPRTWVGVATTLWQTELRPHVVAYLSPMLAAACLLLIPAVRRQSGEGLRAALVLFGAGLASALVAGCTRWVQWNCDWRYWFPFYFLALTAVGIALAAPLAELFRGRVRSTLTAVVSLCLVLLVLGQYGAPSLAKPRARLDSMRGGLSAALADDVIGAECTHIAGDFWTVLADSYYVNLRLHELGRSRKVWPVTMTSLETWDDWARLPPQQMRVAVPLVDGRLDPDAEKWLSRFFPVTLAEMTVVEKRPTCWVFRPAAAVALENPPSTGGAALLTTWHSGFYDRKGESRWCQRRGELTLTNPATEPRTVTLSMEVRAHSAGSPRLWIDDGDARDVCTLSPNGARYCRTVTVPASRSLTLVFSTDAARRDEGWRRAHFQIDNFEVSESGR